MVLLIFSKAKCIAGVLCMISSHSTGFVFTVLHGKYIHKQHHNHFGVPYFIALTTTPLWHIEQFVKHIWTHVCTMPFLSRHSRRSVL